MGSFSQTRSPVLALPPQLAPQSSFNMEPNPSLFSSPFGANSLNPSPPSSSWSMQNSTSHAPSSAAGRKRSRDEAAENLVDDEYFPNLKAAPLPPPIENEEEWEYGEGMTLIKPNANYVMSAENQSGTWVEEKVEPQQSPTPAQSPQRPTIRPHKSQRLNLTASDVVDDLNLSSNRLVAPLSSTTANGLNSNGGPSEPTVDDFTRHLGIGWSSISADSDIQAAARGWTKFIENHFPVTDVKIRLQSRGLASYLVEASEGYFLFGEDLKQGRLVSRDLSKTWENLRANPPIFDGDAILEAGESPKAINGGGMESFTMTTTNALQQAAGNWNHEPKPQALQSQSFEVEMDMS
ncbi:hypothetical protein PVAG01_01727 [Phlyctema vagabunda]|uniref:Uncharacterized protein n=1 Tax=Phlyctema vagabunda TaxID=108571 RepID=A0ABR4PXX3_9HELO